MAQTVRIHGLKEFLRATDNAGKATKKLVRDRLREVAKPVLEDARRGLSRYDARSASRLGISVRKAGTVSVEQRLRRTTGAHPQFGALQQHQVLEPALSMNTAVVMRGFEDALDDIADIFEGR
jgi:hypothetical protein